MKSFDVTDTYRVITSTSNSIQDTQYGTTTTVELPNKGHVGDNINSAVLSFIESCPLSEVLNVLNL